MLPLVSCYLATYGKPADLLGEAVACFLAQDYPADRRELVILSDTPGITFTCAVPGVRVVNHPTHILPLGRKRNATAKLCRGEVLWVWNDDDLYLPHGMSFAISRMGAAPFFHTRRALWTQAHRNDFQRAENLHHCALFERADYFWAHGGYNETRHQDDDQALWREHHLASEETTWADTYYVYRWAGVPPHVSAVPHYAPCVAPGSYAVVPPDLSATFAACYRVTGRATA